MKWAVKECNWRQHTVYGHSYSNRKPINAANQRNRTEAVTFDDETKLQSHCHWLVSAFYQITEFGEQWHELSQSGLIKFCSSAWNCRIIAQLSQLWDDFSRLLFTAFSCLKCIKFNVGWGFRPNPIGVISRQPSCLTASSETKAEKGIHRNKVKERGRVKG